MKDFLAVSGQMFNARLLKSGSERGALISPVISTSNVPLGAKTLENVLIPGMVDTESMMLNDVIGSKENVPVPTEAKSNSEATREGAVDTYSSKLS